MPLTTSGYSPSDRIIVGRARRKPSRLYHLANPQMVTWKYEESDIVQMAVFMAVWTRRRKAGR